MVALLLGMMIEVAIWLVAARPGKSNQPTYIGLALLAVLLVVALVKAYRTWEEIHDVEQPDSPGDLLASFEQAHAAGELDDEELERVRERLGRSPTLGAQSVSSSPPERGPVVEDLDRSSRSDDLAKGEQKSI